MSLRPFLLLCCIALIVAPTAASPVVRFTPASLDVDSITPDQGVAGSTGIYRVSGNGFMWGPSVYLEKNGTFIEATGVTRYDYWTLDCTIHVPADAGTGSYTVRVVNADTSTGYTASKSDAFTVIPALAAVPPGTALPTDTNADGTYDDVNGNGRADFADVVLYFDRMDWIAANEPLPGFDCTGNGRIDFADVVWLFNRLGGTPAPASVFSIVDEPEPGLYRFSAAQVQAKRRTTPYEWAEGTGGAGDYWTSRVDPMQILGMYPLLRLRDGFVLRAYITGDMMGANGIVFVLPAGQAPPGPGLPSGADLNFTEYIEVDGSPASYLEAVVCSIELRSFAEFWHQVDWRAKAFIDSKPIYPLTYIGPEPAIWSPTVRVGPSETRVVFHTLSSRTGVLEEHTVRFIPGLPGCDWSSSCLAYGGPSITP